MCSFGSCETCFEFLSQFRKVRNGFECFVTQLQTRLPKTKRVWPMKINVICTVTCSGPRSCKRAGPDLWDSLQTHQLSHFDVLYGRVISRGVPLRVRVGRICAIVVLLGTRSHPMVQHWWHAMASNCMIHSQNCVDTVPSNIGTFGLDDGRDVELLIPLLLLVGGCWMSPLFPCSSSCVGRWLRSWPPLWRWVQNIGFSIALGLEVDIWSSKVTLKIWHDSELWCLDVWNIICI